MMNFRKYENEDKLKVVDLLNNCLDRKNTNKITIESFQWKHFDQFFGGQTVAFVAACGNQIVSFVCFTPFALSNGKPIWNCCIQATNTNYRRQGIITKLTQLCQQQIQDIYQTEQYSLIGFSNLQGVQIDQNSSKINHQILGQFRQIIIFPSSPDLAPVTTGNKKIQPITWKKNKEYLSWKYERSPKIKYQKIEIENYMVFVKESWFKVEICDIIGLENQDLAHCFCTIVNSIKAKFPFKILVCRYFYNSLTDFISNQKSFLHIHRPAPIWLTASSSSFELLDSDNWLLFGGDIA